MEAMLENYSKSQLVALVKEQQSAASIAEKKVSVLEKKTSVLEKEASKYEQENVRLKSKTTNLEFEIARLNEQVAQLNRIIYGQKRERFIKKGDPQLTLPFEMEEELKEEIAEQATEKITYERKKKNPNHKGRGPLPDHLPVEEIEIYPEGDLSDMVQVGSEVTDELEYTPASYRIKRYIRYKYAPKNGTGVLIGKLPERFIDKCIAGPGLLASILVDKYVDHLPLYRQVQRFKREKIPIAPSTIEGWVKQSLSAIRILYEHLIKVTRSKGYLQADETPVKVLDKGKKGVPTEDIIGFITLQQMVAYYLTTNRAGAAKLL